MIHFSDKNLLIVSLVLLFMIGTVIFLSYVFRILKNEEKETKE